MVTVRIVTLSPLGDAVETIGWNSSGTLRACVEQ